LQQRQHIRSGEKAGKDEGENREKYREHRKYDASLPEALVAIPTSLVGSFAGDVGSLCPRLKAARAIDPFIVHAGASLVFCSAEFG
jgi:hypothetical protein